MAFDWADVSALADALGSAPLAGCDVEAQKRAAISRAYYGLAVRARNALAGRLGVSPDRAPMHLPLADHLKGSTDAGVKQLGFALDSMRRRRNRADYDDEVRGLDAELQIQLVTARQAEPHVARI